MGSQGSGAARAAQNLSPVAGLSRFFPDATPVRIPVQMSRTTGEAASAFNSFSESTVIEFGTPREVLFACSTPLEFSDVVRLRNSDGSFDIEVAVVAVQYHPDRTIVAARFLSEVSNWIVKP